MGDPLRLASSGKRSHAIRQGLPQLVSPRRRRNAPLMNADNPLPRTEYLIDLARLSHLGCTRRSIFLITQFFKDRQVFSTDRISLILRILKSDSRLTAPVDWTCRKNAHHKISRITSKKAMRTPLYGGRQPFCRNVASLPRRIETDVTSRSLRKETPPIRTCSMMPGQGHCLRTRGSRHGIRRVGQSAIVMSVITPG